MEQLISTIIQVLSVLIASTVHEFSHAFVADKLGDHTPRMEGRLTLNPISHIDPIGAISLFLFHFGWSKPVPINPNNFEKPIIGTALVSIAGPASNIIMALLSVGIAKIINVNFVIYLFPFIIINFALAFFNLLPIAPLDGFKIISALLPFNLRIKWEELERYGMIILILFVLPISPLNVIFEKYMSSSLNWIINEILF
jgi:Zn-dependent protease